ncbi:type I restriction enzyme HsdR N-terminal domain-containing protein [Oxalobacteraceae sp. CFBP 8763]|nr:type I restriction enzyme HsdR N-terminal domain-containing protein [Oxalobacteraceae sp. CFBP 8763]
MDLIDQLNALASRIRTTKDLIQTEEATKNAMVMPFIQILGYNVFDPTEVTPELIADIGTKKGEKVDYAILRDGKPIMLFECKKSGGDLHINHAGQLFRYFHVTASRFGVLTNGLKYRFFTDLEQPNKMDNTPFFEFDILDFKERDVEELKKFAKASFDVDTILNTASDLKYTRAIQERLNEWVINPPDEFVRLLSVDLLAGRRFTPTLKDQFTQITRRAFEQLLSERINVRLKGAMAAESPLVAEQSAPIIPLAVIEPEVDTSPEEIEGLHIIRSILRDVVSPRRIVMRDNLSYCAILLDDNNRKPVCRLRFNNAQKLAVGIFGQDKAEERFSLDVIDDLYNFADRLRATVTMHLPAEE